MSIDDAAFSNNTVSALSTVYANEDSLGVVTVEVANVSFLQNTALGLTAFAAVDNEGANNHSVPSTENRCSRCLFADAITNSSGGVSVAVTIENMTFRHRIVDPTQRNCGQHTDCRRELELVKWYLYLTFTKHAYSFFFVHAVVF